MTDDVERMRKRGEMIAQIFESQPEYRPLLEGLRTQRVYRKYHPRPWALFWAGFIIGALLALVVWFVR